MGNTRPKRRNRKVPKVNAEPTRQSARLLNHQNKDNGAEKRKKWATLSSLKLEKEKPLPNLPPEMILQILKAVATKDLLSCRLVSRTWHKFATELYRNRSDSSQLQILRMFNLSEEYAKEETLFVYLIRPEQSYWNQGPRYSKGTVPQLMELLQKSKDLSTFPCTNFRFSLPLRMTDTDKASRTMAAFLKLYSSHIRFLTLATMYQNKWINILGINIRNLLVSILPNVQELTLDAELSKATTSGFFIKLDYRDYLNEVPEYLEGVKIGIKCLKIMGDPADISFEEGQNKLLVDILTAAEYLERIEPFPETSQLVFDPKRLSRLWELGKIHAVKEAHFSPKSEDLTCLEIIADCGKLIVEKLTVDLGQIEKDDDDGVKEKTGEILNKILSSSSKMLKILKLKNSMGFLPNLTFPVMEQLQNLLIDDQPNSEETSKSSVYLQSLSAINPRIKFPSLSSVTVQFDLSREDMAKWTNFFPCPVFSSSRI